ncbi:NDR1/HIN1-like protein 6 [Phragmites australis]|uniref:NDR1/HIN1-like protein 6 n=1 Tax=Phragmites australis TaxID=29695 RepID=UPI002D77FFAF|nr:NDR1/HIN1-like protein 6 [Phragmites australis]
MSSNGKPTPQPPAATSNGAGGPPKMYQRPIYRPQQAPAKRRRGRSCPFSCCCCFFWTVLIVLLLAFIVAVAGGAFYLFYRPHRPAFTLSVARVTKLSLSSSATVPALTDSIDVTLTAKNPNKKLVYLYDDFTVTAATAANAVPLGEASVPGFAHEAGNITVIKATVSASALGVDPTAASSDIKKSGDFSITLDLETKAGVKVGGLKTKKIGIQVHCDGIKVAVPATPPAPAKKKKLAKAAADAPSPAAVDAPSPAAVDDAPSPPAAATTVARVCQVRIRVKIWKWTF